MPKVLGLFGRAAPRLGTRRISFILIAISLLAVFSLVFTLPGGLPDGPSLSRYADHTKFSVSLPDLKKIKNPFSLDGALNPFRQPSHPPPRQKNDTFEESSWWADWKWLVPFSSSLTLDEDRSLLPPLVERPPVYCYYDDTVKRDSDTKDAESELLLTWRMAWWAKGFKPLILSAAEAMDNPQYDALQRVEVDPVVKTELMRWLAFDTMGGGLMSHYTLLPMGPYEDPLLTFLRRGEYPTLTKWQDMGAGFFVGSKELVSSVTEAIFNKEEDELKKAHDVFALMGESTFYTEASPPKSLAYYDTARLEADYPKIAEEVSKDRPKGLHTLNRLINAHLHVMWQNVFSDGVAVLKPHAKHTTPLVADAWELAHLLAECPDSPAPESCPPNYPTCSRCEPGRVKISTPEQYSNASTLFTIGTVPHPYTLATLSNMRDTIDVKWIRREMSRDPWVNAVMTDSPGVKTGGGSHVTRVKAAIAGEPSSPAHGIWLTAEKEPPGDLHWYFGFVLPANSTKLEEEAKKGDGTDAEAERERDILSKALKVGASSEEGDVKVRDAIEAWNLADVEAWKFARAFLARRTVERMGWEEDERRYVDGAGSEEGRHRWNRWMDKIGDKLA